ncbi:MAG: TetR/AcrR family transcriptional regulator [Candidatus Riflebacteria bacterium]|nr:TetR/AcrR family transcriptional regulator [Candidatus Riflebacteria bacterium]
MTKKKSKKELILEAGLELFFEKGFEKTTIDDIINLAECGKGTFYRYFSNKDSLLEELENVFVTTLSKEIQKNCCSTMGLKEYLTASLNTFLSVFKQHQRLGLIRFEREQRLNLEARRASFDKVLPNIHALRDYITNAIKTGVVRQVDPENVVGMVLGVAHFYLVRDFKLGKPFSPKELEDSVDIILYGVAKS